MLDKLLSPLIALADRGHPDMAEEQACDQIDTLLNFLLGLYHKGRLEDKGKALTYAQVAVTIRRSPKNVSNLVFMLNKAGYRDEAITVFENYRSQAQAMSVEMADIWYNYGCVLMESGKLELAASAFREARARSPACPMTHYQLSSVLMALGEFREGLVEDQFRFEAHSHLNRFRKRFPAPDWDGIRRERVLVFSEQGFGDALHCARYLGDLRLIASRVILEVQTELSGLFQGMVDEVYERKNTDFTSEIVPQDRYDSVVSINSLPLYFDPDFSRPATIRYLNPTVDIPPVLLLQERPRVGLVWAGSRFHVNDRDRSCPLKYLAPLFDVPGVTLLNFQQGDMIRTWCNGASTLWDGDDNYEVVDLVADSESLISRMPNVVVGCKSFFDTALLLCQLDLLITVDTALAHLAGAMGVPTWLLLPHCHEWRWRRDWYTSIKYYRQSRQGDWPGLAQQVALDLKNLRKLAGNVQVAC